LLEALPRIYQVTPDIPTGDERQNKRKSGHARPTASKRVSSPPGRDHPHRVGRHRQGESKQQASMQQRDWRSPLAAGWSMRDGVAAPDRRRRPRDIVGPFAR
jgi:hypothetical protein